MRKNKEKVYKIKGSPFFWRLKAEQLRHSAEILWPHAEEWLEKLSNIDIQENKIDYKELGPDVFPTFMALLGFSTECLFKATIIRDNKQFISNGKMAKQLKSHDLIWLAKTAKIRLTNHEQIFCRQAHEHMVNYRYPIPAEIAEENFAHKIDGHCKTVFTELYDRLFPGLDQFGNSNYNMSFK